MFWVLCFPFWIQVLKNAVVPQELVAPDQFWYTSSAKLELPFPILGLVAFEFWAMHFVSAPRLCELCSPSKAPHGYTGPVPVILDFVKPTYRLHVNNTFYFAG